MSRSKTHRQTRMGREERYRLSVWLENRAMIEQHNQLYYEVSTSLMNTQ